MNRPAKSIETHFEDGGSLPRPGVVGRMVRLLFGALLGLALYSMFTDGLHLFTLTAVPRSLSFWLFALIAIHITPYVVNIGFGVNWRRKPQLVLLLAAVALIAVDVTLYGTWWAPPLGIFVWGWLVYFSAHLGLSFLLSTLLSTPGCEMRAIPQLWTVVTGKATKEHYCPGPLDRIDRWETGRRRA